MKLPLLQHLCWWTRSYTTRPLLQHMKPLVPGLSMQLIVNAAQLTTRSQTDLSEEAVRGTPADRWSGAKVVCAHRRWSSSQRLSPWYALTQRSGHAEHTNPSCAGDPMPDFQSSAQLFTCGHRGTGLCCRVLEMWQQQHRSCKRCGPQFTLSAYQLRCLRATLLESYAYGCLLQRPR